MYLELYDQEHRMVAVSGISGEKERNLQKGLREYLLCAACEGRLSKVEAYSAGILRGLPNLSSSKPGHIEFVQNVDYKKFKLFAISLIWRMGVSSLPTFEEVDLGPHEAMLQNLLQTDDPGKPLQYGVVLARPNGSAPLEEFLKPPVATRLEGHRVFIALFFGLVWIFFVSGHSTSMTQTRSFIGPTNELPIHIAGVSGAELIGSIASEMKKAGLL